MSIEIGNYITIGQPLEPSKETKTGEAQIRANQAHQETGIAVETLTTTENASRCDLTNTARLFQLMEDAIATESPVDPKRIALVATKIAKGELGILQNSITERLTSAEIIANQLLNSG